MTRLLWESGGCVFERGACGSFRCYSGEAARVMRVVMAYCGRVRG